MYKRAVVFFSQQFYFSFIRSIQLCQLRSVRRSLATEATRALVQTFISCRLDYCNSLLAGVAYVYLRRLQSVQNAAARLVSGARRHDHITPVLVGLHWLPVRQRIMAVLVWKCLHDAAPHYLADLCVPAHSSVREYVFYVFFFRFQKNMTFTFF